MTEPELVARRKPWLAGLLSGFQPGLGQLYNGQYKKAILFALSPFLGPLLVAPVIYAPFPPIYNIALTMLVAGAVLVAIVRDAMRVARREGNSYRLKSLNKWYVYLTFALLCVFVIQPTGIDLIRQFIKAFRMPSPSMAPTLQINDHFLVDKTISWSGKALQRGDIVVFKFPEDETKEFVKRIIGLPGETIHIRKKTVYVNGTALDDSAYTQRIDPGFLDEQVNPRDTFGPVTVPAESYFVMGDNRDQSLDSRFFGYVQRSKVMGKMLLVYWSWDQEDNRVRWERIGQRIQ